MAKAGAAVKPNGALYQPALMLTHEEWVNGGLVSDVPAMPPSVITL
jgi:hypothetical protein